MPSDVILNDESIRLQGPTFDLHGHTLVLDNSPRDDSVAIEALRRPLVHDDAVDTLTINWGEKYTGGVNILGTVSVPGQTKLGNVNITGQLSLADAAVNGHLKVTLPTSAPTEVGPPVGVTPPPIPVGVVGAAGDPAPVVVGGVVGMYLSLKSTPAHADVGSQLRLLRELIRDLDERVGKIETR